MGLLEQEIKELRQMNKQLIAGNIKPSEVNARIAIYSQTEKRAKMILQAYALGAKFGPGATKRISKTQLIGDGSVIDLNTDIESESIQCPDQCRTITRAECKEYSETTGNLAACSTCENFKTTRKLLGRVETA